MTRAARWARLLTTERLGAPGEARDPERSPFEQDTGRVTFSSAFRRLQDKTQVFPLSKSDTTRTRLTHSLEVASIGRSLGERAGRLLSAETLLPEGVSAQDVGAVVSAACLAHDVGNPPFGHSGEDAIRTWAARFLNAHPGLDLTLAEREDFLRFEGNAQTFRIYARTQARERDGGLRLTLPTLGTLVKYPCPSTSCGPDAGHAYAKWGYVQADAPLAARVFAGLGLTRQSGERERYVRHPLVYLMEAADDICYAVADLEDAYRLGLIGLRELLDVYANAADLGGHAWEEGAGEDHAAFPANRAARAKNRVIARLVDDTFDAFRAHLPEIEAGTFTSDLIHSIPEYAARYAPLKALARERGYESTRVLQIELAGYRALGGLLDALADAFVTRPDGHDSRKLQQLVPEEFYVLSPTPYHEVLARRARGRLLEHLSTYERLLTLTDYVSGMTDRYALETYQYLTGIKLP
ncbi:dGTP triphosphohydrolase [Deinococcus maricopensis]|uniref:Deoxyguanosinetriphosphate triphosphohydrolase n=1 Tax=Deinococcus maricopensis (strain DSM 21211 / LMG 22137 / NRRL B-23946 / LB-34) TaxID=709986 RepID=E8UA87_DEIML|nr:dNTP triphosphohydrolase [Deinococcus maricopensis]ADV67976.1 deoxyguanosinetriphosphate triphosphohydrolase [Deinococcus maricopensis DSM 21211]